MSVQNQGTGLQAEINQICTHYLKRGRAKIHKVDPPVRIVGRGAGRRVIFMANPWLDYAGTVEGQAIVLEAKQTQDARLSVDIGQPLKGNVNGITKAQVEALQAWQQAGALTGVLWGHNQRIRFVPTEYLEEAKLDQEKSIKWHEALVIPAGESFCTFDFLTVVLAWHQK